MGVIDWFKRAFRLTGNLSSKELAENTAILMLAADISYKKLAIDACVNLIAATLAGCEFLTFKEGKEVRGELYDLLNYRPNFNVCASEFWNSFIARLLKNNEVLVVQPEDGNLYVADGFNVDDTVLYPRRYREVTVGSLTFSRWFDTSEVLHITLHDENIKRIIDGIYNDYGQLIAFAEHAYRRKNATRVVVETPSATNLTPEAQEEREKLFSVHFKNWFNADNAGAALPLPKDLKLNDWSDKERTKHDSRDVRALIDDVFDFVAAGFRVPVRLLRGDVAELSQAVDSLIMFCIKPLAELIQDEINTKMFRKSERLQRTYVKIDISQIKLVDVTKMANAADKLFGAGIHSINENRRMLDLEPIAEPFADKHFYSKNYSTLESITEENN